MSSDRKQSISSDQVLEREGKKRLPVAGVPNIANYQYDDTPVQQIDDTINDPIEAVNTLRAPSELDVISQSIRFAPDGTQYVSVVIEFNEVEGADGYEARTART